MIIVIGDFIIDEYQYVDITRVSPEAPCLIGKTIDPSEKRLGGAGNVFANIANLTKQVIACGPMTKETFEIIKSLRTKDVLTIPVPHNPTKVRFIDSKSRIQVFRNDIETETPKLTGDASEEKRYCDFINSIPFKGIDVCVLADYGKGMIRGEKKFRLSGCKINIVSTKNTNPFMVMPSRFINKRDPKTVNILALNNDEYKAAKEILGYDYIVRTHGANGIQVLKCTEDPGMVDHTEEIVFTEPGRKVDVFDVTGAGDTVVATIAYWINRKGFSEDVLFDAVRLANYAASIVVGKSGTVAINYHHITEFEKTLSTYSKKDL